jgi:hypothetical protein
VNCIRKFEAAAQRNGWACQRWVTGDGYTAMVITRPGDEVRLRLRHYQGRPQLVGGALGLAARPSGSRVDDVVAYLCREVPQ